MEALALAVAGSRKRAPRETPAFLPSDRIGSRWIYISRQIHRRRRLRPQVRRERASNRAAAKAAAGLVGLVTTALAVYVGTVFYTFTH